MNEVPKTAHRMSLHVPGKMFFQSSLPFRVCVLLFSLATSLPVRTLITDITSALHQHEPRQDGNPASAQPTSGHLRLPPSSFASAVRLCVRKRAGAGCPAGAGSAEGGPADAGQPGGRVADSELQNPRGPRASARAVWRVRICQVSHFAVKAAYKLKNFIRL